MGDIIDKFIEKTQSIDEIRTLLDSKLKELVDNSDPQNKDFVEELTPKPDLTWKGQVLMKIDFFEQDLNLTTNQYK